MKASLLFILLVLFSFYVVNSQTSAHKTVKIKGVVSDSEGLPIAKAYVFIDSMKTGFRTNKKGEYKLKIPLETNFISIFSKKYGIQNMVYNGEKEMHFTFPKKFEVITKPELVKLGYIFNVDVFRNISKKSYAEYSDIFQIIREKFSGVAVNGTSIVIRGASTLAGSAYQPLFIVDGNYVNSLTNINPAEIKTIELLKGESTALYGARGGSGVIIVTLIK